MAEFTLPKNSKITAGKSWAAPPQAHDLREYRIYRWNPEDGANPRLDTYHVDLGDCGPMVLDALIWIKNKIDPTLACTKDMADIKGAVKIYPLPHMPVIKDLVPDMTNFYAQQASIKPWLRT